MTTQRRTVCAVFWALTFVLALGGLVTHNPLAVMSAWAATVVLTIVTAILAKLGREELLVRPRLYRGVTAVALVAALGGCLLGVLPHASEWSRVFAVFFAVAAIVTYRAVIARGPRAAMLAIVIVSWTWLPFVMLMLTGCGCRHRDYVYVPAWTEIGSEVLLQITLLLVPILGAVTLLAFAPRSDELPEARLHRG